MSKIVTLKENRDFRGIYHRGKSKVHPLLVTYIRPSRAKNNTTRIGITASKKVGGAVERNRCRRIIKEAYRLLLPKIEGNFDVVFVARQRTLSAKMPEILKVMQHHLYSLGVFGAKENKNTNRNRRRKTRDLVTKNEKATN